VAQFNSVLKRLRKRLLKSGLASVAAVILIAAPAAANCLDLAAPASAISTNCKKSAQNEGLKSYQRGIAAFNTARALLASASSSSGSANVYAEAATWIDESYRGLSDTSLMSPNRETLGLSSGEWRKWQKAPRAGFQFDRKMALATALKGLALADPFVSGPVCASKRDCLNKAITQLESDSIPAPFAAQGKAQGDWRYNEFYYQRASLYVERGDISDADRAIDDFRKVLNSSRPERRSDAGPALEQLALRLATESLARGGTSINQAIRFFTIARDARPDNAAANVGLGESYLYFCRDSTSTAAQRLPNCLSASDAFKGALAAPGAYQLEVQLGIGEALLAAANQQQILNPRDPSISRYRQESSDAYARAAGLGGGNALAKLQLARALQATQPDRAFEAFRDYVGFELSYPDWFDAGAGSVVGTQFQQKVSAIGNGETRRNIGEAALAMYKLRPSPDGLRKEVGISLLNAALQAQPMLADASSELGKLHLIPPVDRIAARLAFNGVINSTGGPNGPPATGREKMRAEAFYQLSRIEAETAGSPTRASTTPLGLKHALDAFTLDSAEPRYKKAACIAYIVTFKYTVADPGNASWCSGNSGADGQLLLGMYHLRVARTAPAAKKKQIREEARRAFRQGQALVPSPDEGSPVIEFKSEWPNAPAEMSVRRLLDYGEAVVDFCDGTSVRLPMPNSEVARASGQFGFFGVGIDFDVGVNSCNG
jgi:hypothetical protein